MGHKNTLRASQRRAAPGRFRIARRIPSPTTGVGRQRGSARAQPRSTAIGATVPSKRAKSRRRCARRLRLRYRRRAGYDPSLFSMASADSGHRWISRPDVFAAGLHPVIDVFLFPDFSERFRHSRGALCTPCARNCAPRKRDTLGTSVVGRNQPRCNSGNGPTWNQIAQ